MTNVNIHEAKSNLSALIHSVEAGEEVVIMRAGVPVARLLPFQAESPRQLGILRDTVQLVDEAHFDAPMSDEWFTPSPDL